MPMKYRVQGSDVLDVLELHKARNTALQRLFYTEMIAPDRAWVSMHHR